MPAHPQPSPGHEASPPPGPLPGSTPGPTQDLGLDLRERLALGAYGGLMQMARPLLLRKLSRRARTEPVYAQAVPERFGHYTQPAEPQPERVWVHAVSLGETRAAAVLLQAWRARRPDLRLLLTHGTATGREEGRALLRPGDVQVWQPWDAPGAVQRFFRHFKPRLGVLMETEVWPQLVAGARAHGVPLVLANARLSEKSHAQARRWPALSRPAYASLAAALAQTEADGQRLSQLGARVQAVLGNLKFDARPDAAQLALAHRRRQERRFAPGGGQGSESATARVLMLASSREGEEGAFLDAWCARPLPQVQPLIVPRHPQRFDAVVQLARERGLAVQRRSEWGAQLEGLPPAQPGTLWVGDSLGEMALYYGLADLALLGGSFAPLGGQNLIEAAACGCPVLMGPHTFNFLEAAERAQAEGAALRVADFPGALSAGQALCAEPARRQQMADAALAFAGRHRGAADRTAAALDAWLGPVSGALASA